MSFASVFSRVLPVPMCHMPARAIRPAALSSVLLAVAAILPVTLRAQTPGSQDSDFLAALSGSTVFAVSTQYAGPDVTENILAGGDQAGFDDLDGKGLFMGDFTFPVFGNVDRIVYAIAPELVSDDVTKPYTYKVLVGGSFGKTQVNKVVTASRNIIRISLNGTIDTSFDPGKGADDLVTAILPQSDGSIFVGGTFLEFNQKSYPRLVRLQRNGSIQPGFPSIPVGDTVFALAAQIDPATGLPNGQVLFSGDFTTIGSATYTKLARIDQAGNLDPTFKPVIDQRVIAIAVQPDGKIVIGGQFTTVNGQAVNHLARLNQDGSLDPSFAGSVTIVPALTTDPVAVYVLKLLPDGRIYVGGNFSVIDGVSRQYLGLIEPDGSLDTAFDPGTTITNSVQALAIQNDSRVLVGETVSKKINNVYPPSLIRLYGDTPNDLSLISVSATQPNASEGTNATRKVGVVTFTRTDGNTGVPLTIYFAVSGSAQNGVAYKPLAATQFSNGIYQLTFPANVNKARVKIKPRNRTLPDAPETVTLTLLPSQNASALYNVNIPVVGTVEISNTP